MKRRDPPGISKPIFHASRSFLIGLVSRRSYRFGAVPERNVISRIDVWNVNIDRSACGACVRWIGQLQDDHGIAYLSFDMNRVGSHLLSLALDGTERFS